MVMVMRRSVLVHNDDDNTVFAGDGGALWL